MAFGVNCPPSSWVILMLAGLLLLLLFGGFEARLCKGNELPPAPGWWAVGAQIGGQVGERTYVQACCYRPFTFCASLASQSGS